MFYSLFRYLALTSVISHIEGATAPIRNDGIHLAVGPKCGSLSGAPADVNAGLLPLKSYKTLVTFGVSA